MLSPSFPQAQEGLDRINARVKPAPYRRIISLAPSITEILFSLSLGERVAGVTRHCDYPPAAIAIPKIGTYIDISVETILSLKPDLVIATADGNDKRSVERLVQLGIPVLVIHPRNLPEVFETILQIGRVTRTEAQAQILVRSLRARADRIIRACAPLPRPRVFLQINDQPLITVGRPTFHHHLITLAGGSISAAGDHRLSQIQPGAGPAGPPRGDPDHDHGTGCERREKKGFLEILGPDPGRGRREDSPPGFRPPGPIGPSTGGRVGGPGLGPPPGIERFLPTL